MTKQAKETIHHKIVLRGHLNDYGNLFGGYLLQWIDELGYISVSLDFPGQHFVTIGLDNVEFKHSIREGQILRFVCCLLYTSPSPRDRG